MTQRVRSLGLGLVLCFIATPESRGDYFAVYSPVAQGSLSTNPFNVPPQTFVNGLLQSSFSSNGTSSTPAVSFDLNSVALNGDFTRADLILNVNFYLPIPLSNTMNITYGYDSSSGFLPPSFLQVAGPSGPVGLVSIPPSAPQVSTLTVDVTSILVSQRQLGGRYLKFFGFQSGQGAIQFSSIILGVVPEPPSALLAILGLSGVAVGYRLLGRRRLAGQAASLVQKA